MVVQHIAQSTTGNPRGIRGLIVGFPNVGWGEVGSALGVCRVTPKKPEGTTDPAATREVGSAGLQEETRSPRGF